MKTVLHLCQLVLLIALIVVGQSKSLHAQERVIELTIHARSVPDNPTANRLLPREHELRDGNAAIELLRMPWEQTNFMQLSRKRMNDWLEMEGDDPELLEYESAFAVFKGKMRRAAYIRNADWDYPIGEQPLVTILLPDVQGMRSFVGRVMSLWIRVQISKGELKNAEEGILIQMACARHVCRTPFIVCHLVGAAIAGIGFGQMENLIQHPEAENYYYALSRLPATLGDFESAVDLDATILRSSMPSIDGKPLPVIGDPVWKKAFMELFENFISQIGGMEKIDREVLQQQAEKSAKALEDSKSFSKEQISKMSDEEIFIRWLLGKADTFGGKYSAALQLPMHDTIQSLARLEKEVIELDEKIIFRNAGSPPPGASPVKFFDFYTPQAFMACHRIGSTAKLLQIVESLRHHASLNGNKLPASLDDIDLPLPRDPFTGEAAIYEIENGVATLRWPVVPNVSEKLNNSRQSYRIKLADGK